MEPIRVLQVLDKISEDSGVSAVVMNYYNHIDKNKFQIDFMVNKPVGKQMRSEIEKSGSKIFQMPPLAGKQIPGYKKALEDFFCAHQGEYDILHGNIPNAALFYMTAAQKWGIPVRILHSHNARGADGIYKKIRNFALNQMGIKYANTYFACSKPAADYLFGEKSRKEVTILPNAIDVEKYARREAKRDEMRRALKVEQRLVIGHVGRFAEQKNHAFLLQIAGEMKRQSIQAVFLLIGSGTLMEQIKQNIKKEQLEEYFRFIGSVTNVEDYLQAMDVFVLPSRYEGLPVVGVEAQAAGLPCIFSEAVTREVQMTKQVCFLSINEPKDWAAKIMELGKMENDSNAGTQIRQSGFAVDTEAKKLEKKYMELTGRA